MPSASEIARRLRQAGFAIVKHGSRHEIWEDAAGRRVILWRHGKKEIPTGTYNSILRSAGLSDAPSQKKDPGSE